MRLIGLSTNVTLYDVQQNRTTLKLAENFLQRRSEIKNCINEREVFGISTNPEDYNPETDPFEFLIGIQVSSNEDIPEGMEYREISTNSYVLFIFKGPFENAGIGQRMVRTESIEITCHHGNEIKEVDIRPLSRKIPFYHNGNTTLSWNKDKRHKRI